MSEEKEEAGGSIGEKSTSIDVREATARPPPPLTASNGLPSSRGMNDEENFLR